MTHKLFSLFIRLSILLNLIPLISIGASPNNSTDSSLPAATSSIDKEGALGEVIIGESPYPASSLDSAINTSELQQAIADYYQDVLPKDEQLANHEPIAAEKIAELEKDLRASNILAPLEIHLDQVTMELNQKTNYILRIVVKHSYSEAQELLEDNDILVINEVLAQLGNRLVLLSYYDSETEILTPYHLNNRAASLFTLEGTEIEPKP